MDFTIALTHFCETHGPKSILCTQVIPLECALCLPPLSHLRPRQSSESLATQFHTSASESQAQSTASLRRAETNSTLPTDFSGASTTIDSDPDSSTIERHPLFKSTEGTGLNPQYPYARAQGEACASCSFTAPKPITDKLPAGAPGSTDAASTDSNKATGAPIFRSRQFVCLGSSPPRHRQDYDPLHTQSSSYNSSTSAHSSHSHCHDHTLTYLTSKSPSCPNTYATLRSSVIRTLSCELLPPGMSEGPFCFGDSTSGYTIAYVFRLTDPKARGRRRAYAFVALAGRDSGRAFRSAPMLWEKFRGMARAVEEMSERCQEEKARREEEKLTKGSSGGAKGEKRNYTHVSSFLSQRAVDPDGTPRTTAGMAGAGKRGGMQTSARSLSDIVGDEDIFAVLHQFFVALLRCLGDRFGGLSLAETTGNYQTVAEEQVREGNKVPMRFKKGLVDHEQENPHDFTEDNDDTKASADRKAKAMSTIDKNDEREENEIDRAKKRLSKTISITGQCAPLQVNKAAQRQVVV